MDWTTTALVLGTPVALVALVWAPIFYLSYSKSRAVRRRWAELAKISGMTYHKRGNELAQALGNVSGIDNPKLGKIQQAITGQVEGCWCAIVESVIHRYTLGKALSGSVFSKRIPTTFCVLVSPDLQMPEFCLSKVGGRGLSAAINSLWESRADVGPEFAKRYHVRTRATAETLRVFEPARQAWWLETTPLTMLFTGAGDVRATEYSLEVHVKNSTVTLCCPLTLDAAALQPFVSRTNEIRKALTP